jgi:hypothetical protein
MKKQCAVLAISRRRAQGISSSFHLRRALRKFFPGVRVRYALNSLFSRMMIA